MLRMFFIWVAAVSAAQCGYDILDMSENEMRQLASAARGILRGGAEGCQETGRKTVHADQHMSKSERNALSDLSCSMLSGALSCTAGACTCLADGMQDDRYLARCEHRASGKLTRKTFNYSSEDIATYTASTTPPDSGDGGDDGDDSGTPSPTPAICVSEGEQTIAYGQILGLDSTAPVFVTDQVIIGSSCTSTESGDVRRISCIGNLCTCDAVFKLDTVPAQASCSEN